MPNNRIRFVSIAALAICMVMSTSAGAHERKIVGKHHVVLGWGDEPAFTGVKNAVEIDLADGAGKPVTELGGGTLSVEVIYGDQRVTLPLRPVLQTPGKFRASLIPTRAGVYTFHVSGTVQGVSLDVSSTCSDTTFACVDAATELQFPAKDPSTAELSDRVSRGLPRADDAASAARAARLIAFAAIGVAVAAFAVSVLRKR